MVISHDLWQILIPLDIELCDLYGHVINLDCSVDVIWHNCLGTELRVVPHDPERSHKPQL